ncbi:hypothetical protein EMIHUDRAFT_434371, partial [Emiliania huxleyi CCMP1516]|uniref:Uncharacterized protein n=2 Tax=Emiliania huxleyi TaxID=2903 RepID=A0A0D3K5N0_EMIH1
MLSLAWAAAEGQGSIKAARPRHDDDDRLASLIRCGGATEQRGIRRLRRAIPRPAHRPSHRHGAHPDRRSRDLGRAGGRRCRELGGGRDGVQHRLSRLCLLEQRPRRLRVAGAHPQGRRHSPRSLVRALAAGGAPLPPDRGLRVLQPHRRRAAARVPHRRLHRPPRRHLLPRRSLDAPVVPLLRNLLLRRGEPLQRAALRGRALQRGGARGPRRGVQAALRAALPAAAHRLLAVRLGRLLAGLALGAGQAPRPRALPRRVRGSAGRQCLPHRAAGVLDWADMRRGRRGVGPCP